MRLLFPIAKFGLRQMAALVLVILMVSGCASIPTSEFNGYLSSFNVAKTSSQDLLLNAKLAAEFIANAPNNPDRPTDRVNKLGERRAALDARLAALELISDYNSALCSLASGADPKSVQGQIEGLRDGLSSFGFTKLTALVGKASPYTALIAEAVSLIDDLIKKQKFKQAIQAGEKPILGILEILQEDADSIHEIQSQLILLKRDIEETKLAKLRPRIAHLLNGYQSSVDLDRAVARYNDVVAKLGDSPLASIKLSNPSGQTSATPGELVVVQTLVDEASNAVEGYNQHNDEVAAHQKVVTEYKKMLATLGSSFKTIGAAIKSNQRAAIVGFVQQALQFRQSILELQHAKTP